ncbi:MAG: RNA-guided endonuclease InsQ/TnpB family protein [Metallibacterium sp.]
MSEAAPAEAVSTIERAYRMRVYPTRSQTRTLAQLAGATRFVWNWALDRRSTAYRVDGTKLNWVALSREFTVLRAAPDTAWLSDLPREPFNQVLRDQERAFAGFFAKRAQYPRFRRRGVPLGLRVTLDQRREQVERGHDHDRWERVNLPGLGTLKLRRTEALAGRLRSITLRREAGAWYADKAAGGVPVPVAAPVARAAIGVDIGLKDLIVRSDGVHVPAPAAFRAQLGRLCRYQRHYVRQRDAAARRQGLDPAQPYPKGTRIEVSNRMHRTQQRVADLHARIAAVRREALHRATTDLVRSTQVIAIEDLAVKAMARGMGRRGFRRSVANAAPGELRRQITYKARWTGRTLSVVDRWFPSSKTCSSCGAVNKALQLQERRWTCPACGTEHDRDFNAAVNLEREGLRLLEAGPRAALHTPMSGGIDARGDLGAVAEAQVIALPQHRRSLNRELVAKRCAPNCPKRRSGTGGEDGA